MARASYGRLFLIAGQLGTAEGHAHVAAIPAVHPHRAGTLSSGHGSGVQATVLAAALCAQVLLNTRA